MTAKTSWKNLKVSQAIAVEGTVHLYRWDGVTHQFDGSVPSRPFLNPLGYILARGRNSKRLLVATFDDRPYAGWVDADRCEPMVQEHA